MNYNNNWKLMEFFFYLAIVLIGIFFLFRSYMMDKNDTPSFNTGGAYHAAVLDD